MSLSLSLSLSLARARKVADLGGELLRRVSSHILFFASSRRSFEKDLRLLAFFILAYGAGCLNELEKQIGSPTALTAR